MHAGRQQAGDASADGVRRSCGGAESRRTCGGALHSPPPPPSSLQRLCSGRNGRVKPRDWDSSPWARLRAWRHPHARAYP